MDLASCVPKPHAMRLGALEAAASVNFPTGRNIQEDNDRYIVDGGKATKVVIPSVLRRRIFLTRLCWGQASAPRTFTVEKLSHR